jgi:predicted aldo/keto reductase-like oxidoreductase
MTDMTQLRQNVAAALDEKGLSAQEQQALDRYAHATRAYHCDGCDHLCGAAIDAPVRVGTTMRSLMYHDAYGDGEKARRVFGELPAAARQLQGVDFSRAQAACPNGIDVAQHMQRASKLFA